MGVFNTRPRFQDRDIRQLSGDTISLSGETNINGVFRVVPGAVTGYVLKSLDNYGTVVWQPVSVSADTNTFTTGATLNGTVLEFDRNDLSNAYNVDLNPLIFTGNTSGDCINDIFVKNIHSCLPLNINPLDEGNVYFGSTSGVTIDVINSRLGIGNNTPSERLHISGGDMLVENTNGKFITDIQNIAGAPLVFLSGGTNGITRLGVSVPSFDSLTMGVRGGSDVTFPGYGKLGDGFIYSSNDNNGFNLISSPGTGTDDYIRFYAGQNALPGNTPDLYIQGSGNTRGNVGIGTASPSEILHVEGNTKINGTLNISTLGTGTTISNLGIDSNGFVVSGVNDTNTFVTGGTLTGTDLTLDWNTGGSASPIDLSNLYNVPYWTAGTSGFGSIRVINGSLTDATGNFAVAQGESTTASGDVSHAEGSGTIASGNYSHAEGQQTIASGNGSHAGGDNSVASGTNSFIHSTNSLVTGDRSVVLGGQNITGITSDTVYVPRLNIDTLGGGTSVNNLGIDANGNVVSGITSNLLYTQTNNYTTGVPITINHNLNTTDVLVQIVDANTNQLIYGSINNYQTNSLDVALSISLNNVKVLVIGSPISQIVPKGSIVYTLGHDTISPTDNNDYFIGQNFNLTPSTSSNDGRRFIVQKTGTVTQVSIKRTITGTLGSSETNNFYVNNVTQATQGFITSGETFDSSSSLTNYTLSTPLNVTAGDKLEIEWLTPAWVTNPTTVRQVFNMIIEY